MHSGVRLAACFSWLTQTFDARLFFDWNNVAVYDGATFLLQSLNVPILLREPNCTKELKTDVVATVTGSWLVHFGSTRREGHYFVGFEERLA